GGLALAGGGVARAGGEVDGGLRHRPLLGLGGLALGLDALLLDELDALGERVLLGEAAAEGGEPLRGDVGVEVGAGGDPGAEGGGGDGLGAGGGSGGPLTARRSGRLLAFGGRSLLGLRLSGLLGRRSLLRRRGLLSSGLLGRRGFLGGGLLRRRGLRGWRGLL